MAAAQAAGQGLDPDQEIRFAVVMYGGVSLAIYINGIAQELLHMVRATASKDGVMLYNDAELSLTEVIYRRISQFIGTEAWKNGAEIPESQNGPVRCRFVVDIISGTSAGGINGLFLGKAIANNQGLDGLAKLWEQEGDFAKLLNDKQSVKDLKDSGIKQQKPPKSLLNSVRMYRKLLEAFASMKGGQAKRDSVERPLAEELDVFITTTDIEGLPVPIKLSDGVVYERRHRNVFHFRQATALAAGEDRNDFVTENDPFLAFAARCTSSFPGAFEPMKLADIDAVTRSFPGYNGNNPRKTWEKFFSEYLRPSLLNLQESARPTDLTEKGPDSQESIDILRKAFPRRSFSDGGSLDNKPFTYATSLLMRRSSDVPVQRKLVYVEPSPQHPELTSRTDAPDARPNFLEHIGKAVMELPRYETIREDLEAVVERNRLMRRISVLTRKVDDDVKLSGVKGLNDDEFAQKPIDQLIKLYGLGYGAYHRLRVDEVISMLSNIIARAAGHDPSSDACTAIYAIVDAWYRREYEEQSRETEFLIAYDIPFRLRRFFFMKKRINELGHICYGENSSEAEMLDHWLADAKKTHRAKELAGNSEWSTGFREELKALKKVLNHATTETRGAQEQVLKSPNLQENLKGLSITWKDLETILQAAPGTDRQSMAAQVLAGQSGLGLHSLAAQLAKQFGKASHSSVQFEKQLLVSPPEESNSPDERGIGQIDAIAHLAFCYQNFLLYDLIAFPVQYGTDSAESNITEIYRISPEDAPFLIDERSPGETRKKLAGTFLMNFGAFLRANWRRNDILWGRLDGAERLIKAILPDARHAEARDALIQEAVGSILRETLDEQSLTVLRRVLCNALLEYGPECKSEDELFSFVEGLSTSGQLQVTFAAILNQCLANKNELWRFYRKSYEVDRNLPSTEAATLMSRSVNVIGGMIDDVSTQYQNSTGKKFAGWVSLFGKAFWGIVQCAIPGSIGSLLARHWLSIIYIVDIVILGAGILVNAQLKGLGWTALGVTVVLHLVISTLKMWFRQRAFTGILILSGLVALAFIAYGMTQFGRLIINMPTLNRIATASDLVGWVSFCIAVLMVVVLVFFAERKSR